MVVCQKLFQRLPLLVILLMLSSIVTLVHSTGTKIGISCIEKEREALLKFKDQLIDDYGHLSTWGSEEDKKDCCNWDHVRCDNLTNHIVRLDVSDAFLRGNISISLLDLQHLKYLNLSGNLFYGNRIPQFFGSLRRLEHLDLSNSLFSGEIPHHLGNLSELRYLDLSTYSDGVFRVLTGKNVDWLSGLHSLRYLNLRHVNLSMITNWFETVNKLIQLQELRLHGCHPPMVLPSSRSMFNSSISLHVLDLSGNELTSSWIFPLLFSSNLSYLSELYLNHNKLQGPIPHDLGLSTSLKHLDLCGNMFSGTVTQILKSLAKLEALFLCSNHFQDVIAESDFCNLSQLRSLDMSSNPGISFNFSLGWSPPFQLVHLNLSSCKVGPFFPFWLRTQKELEILDISNAEISGTFPDLSWEPSPKLQYFDVSHNNFHGALPNFLSSKFSSIDMMDFSYNHFNGSLPTVPSYGTVLVLSNNELSGSITKLCNGTDFNWLYLDLSNNLLSGQVPDYLSNTKWYLNLANNSFSGKIPSLNSSDLRTLHLQNNHFTGEIPTSLRNCTSLAFIDLSHNRLTGKIPTWMGDAWNSLLFLSLQSNEFFGSLPSNLCHLARLQVLDLSLNKISGGIPTCLNNFTSMSQVDYSSDPKVWVTFDRSQEFYMAFLTWKGIERGYKKNNLQLVKLIDLSSNNLVGDIPIEITNLVTLVGLNLSKNNLSGTIPSKIGQLRSLDFLDLSRNHFTGDIPTGISQMDRLGVLNLSYNNLSGKIPQSNHMLTFTDTAFEGNNGLCGPPLRKTCPGDETVRGPKTGDNADGKKSQEDEEKFVDYGIYISIALGFIVGFWGVCGTLVLNNSWRIAFFKLSDKVMDWCYERIAISKNRLRESF